MINQELLAKRLMRGALTGHPETEKPPAKYCKGKLDNGRPCMITALDGDYCRRHQKEIDALEAGAPLQPGRMERPFEERIQMAKKGICKICSKKDTQIIGAGMCWTCRKAAIDAGTYPEPASIVPEKVELVEEETKFSDVTTDVNKIGYDDEQEKAMLAGGPIQLDYYTAMGMGDDTENLAHAPASATNLDPVACLHCEGPVERQDLFCKTCAPVEPQISPITATPPQRAVGALRSSQKGHCRPTHLSARTTYAARRSTYSVFLGRIGDPGRIRSITRAHPAGHHYGPRRPTVHRGRFRSSGNESSCC